MPYSTVVTGTVISAAWSNANNRDQVVTPFASAAARTSAITTPIEGMVSYLTDTNVLEVFTGSLWENVVIGTFAGANYSPTFSSVTLGTGGTKYGRYLSFGKLVVGVGGYTLGTGGTVSGTITMTLPFTAGTVGADWIFAARGIDATGGVGASGVGVILDGETVGKNIVTIGGSFWTTSFPFSWGVGDTLRSIFVYEKA